VSTGRFQLSWAAEIEKPVIFFSAELASVCGPPGQAEPPVGRLCWLGRTPVTRAYGPKDEENEFRFIFFQK
jgi:hypothetical protein